MTSEQLVRELYPQAKIISGNPGNGPTKYRIELNRQGLGGWRKTQAEAWDAAAQRLKEKS